LDSSFRPLPGTAPWSIKPAQIPYSPLNGAYVTADDGTEYYQRKVPEHFSGNGDHDDLLMKSLITKYSVEGRTKNGKPSG
jgi:hypothetical protein